jgi:DNA-directed RNA polymerase specialized sigma24 family protein
MTTEQLPCQGELESLLATDPVCFIKALDLHYRKILARYIERWTCGVLDPEELKDAYQEMMAAVWKRVQQPGFDQHSPLRMVYTIARNVAVTMRRRRLRQPFCADYEAVAQAVGEDLTGTQAGLEWRLLSADERREFQDAVADIIARLPPRQQMAAMAFVEIYEELLVKNTSVPLAAAMSRLSGKNEDVAAAMSAWRFAREKIREDLLQKGYGFLRRGNP